jgi:hypothetical protein
MRCSLAPRNGDLAPFTANVPEARTFPAPLPFPARDHVSTTIFPPALFSSMPFHPTPS